MQNAINVKLDGTPFVTILLPKNDLTSINWVLHYYADKFGFDRSKLSATRVDVIDITDIADGMASKPYAKHDWSFSSDPATNATAFLAGNADASINTSD